MAQMLRIARDFAADGYLALAPDLYTNDPGYQKIDVADIIAALGSPHEPDWEERLARIPEPRRTAVRAAREWMTNRPKGHYLDGVRGAFEYLDARDDVNRIGAIGYCLGGQLVGRLAALGVDLAAGVIYYGASPDLGDVPRIRGPLEGHYGVTDRRITGGVYDFALAMKAAGRHFAYTVYDADHGFNDDPPARGHNPYAIRLARDRSNAFLAEHLLQP
jgi:carboxymethylenebutenolidase